MSIGAITGSSSTANLIDAIRALRAGNVAATQAVSNRFDPRDNTQVEEQSSAQQQQAAEAKTEQRRQTLDSDRREQEQASTPRPSSAFLTQALAQEQDGETSERVSATVAGSAAYGNTAYADAVDRASTLSGRSRRVEFEVLSPNPAASSGRGVDLTV
ncbi:hypothetical protein [Paramagnetospirillum caucaseum]|uniref:hypothetical protein n=1 Tax=Paramagnetospirillum caucaseum TaxID=1244869 RepID=UPI00034D2A3F|nr:hypothetical protein [Paramagnetospirillum caucaseum]